jgi:TRAP-type C4-dicarboxylate transport system permease small subunit
LVGVIFLILMVYGGYIWMIARGNDELISKAKDTIRSAIIGIIIVVGAYAITSYLVNAFTSNPTPTSGCVPASEAGKPENKDAPICPSP